MLGRYRSDYRRLLQNEAFTPLVDGGMAKTATQSFLELQVQDQSTLWGQYLKWQSSMTERSQTTTVSPLNPRIPPPRRVQPYRAR